MRIFTPVFIILLLLICLGVSANLDIGLAHYWSLNDTDSNDSLGTWNFSLGFTDLNYTRGKHPPDSLVLYNDNNGDRYFTPQMVDINQTYTINFWINQTGYAVGYIIQYASLGDTFSLLQISSSVLHIYWDSCSFSITPMYLNEWGMITIVSNTTGGRIYINGVLNDSCSGGIKSFDDAISYFYFGDYGNSNSWAFDEIGFWNLSLSDFDVTELYNSGNGLFYPFYEATPPEISVLLNSPDNNSYSDELVNDFCFTATAEYPIDVCGFYTNYSGIFEINFSESGMVNNSLYCLEWNSSEVGSFEWGVLCNTTSGGDSLSERRVIFIVNETISSCYYSRTPTLKMSIPFIQSGSIDWFCEIGFKNASCFTSVIKDGNTIQVNPVPVSVDSVGQIDSFIGSDSLVSSYVRVSFNPKNLLPENEFQFIVTCSNPTQYIRINASVIPEYNQIKGLGSRMIWFKDSVPYIIGLTLIIIIGGFTWYLIRNR